MSPFCTGGDGDLGGGGAGVVTGGGGKGSESTGGFEDKII